MDIYINNNKKVSAVVLENLTIPKEKTQTNKNNTVCNFTHAHTQCKIFWSRPYITFQRHIRPFAFSNTNGMSCTMNDSLLSKYMAGLWSSLTYTQHMLSIGKRYISVPKCFQNVQEEHWLLHADIKCKTSVFVKWFKRLRWKAFSLTYGHLYVYTAWNGLGGKLDLDACFEDQEESNGGAAPAMWTLHSSVSRCQPPALIPDLEERQTSLCMQCLVDRKGF